MMRWIVESSLRFRGLVIAAAAGVIALGISQLPQIPVDTLPEFVPPTVEVQTEALGLSAEEVEQLITVPLEQDLLNGVAFLDQIESVSLPGLSSVLMTFEPGTELLDARQVVAERLTQAVATAGLPEVAKPPQMLQPLSSTSRVSMVKLSSEDLTPIEISVLARWVIAPRLLGVEGVANVAIWGFKDRQLQVQVDPQQLAAAEVTLSDVIRTTGNALEVSPLSFLEASTPGTGGFIDTVNQRLHVFHEQAISTPEELAEVTIEDEEGSAVFRSDGPLTLGDVTRIVEDHQPLIGDAVCRDQECVLLVIERFPDANTPEVSQGVDEALLAMSPGLPGLEIDTSIYRPAAYVESSVSNLGWAVLIGGVLLILILGALFIDWRATLICAVAVIVSVFAAGLFLHFLGVTFNVMVIAGLVLALVSLIDDAVVDVDALTRRVRQRRIEGEGAPAWSTILDASIKMRRSALYGSLIVAVALLPAFFMDGAGGAFLPPTALAYLLAVTVSMVVALTVTPALGLLLLADRPLDRRESPIVRWLHKGYDRLAPRIVTRPGAAIVAFSVLVVAGLVALPFLDQSFDPSLEERDVLIRLEAPPGTSLPRMDEITASAVDELATMPGVAGVGAHVGRAVMSDQIVNVNSGEIWANLEPSADYGDTLEAIESVIDRHPDVSGEVLTYSQQRVTQILRGRDQDVIVRLYGEDREVLGSKAEEVQGLLGGIEGVSATAVNHPVEEPVIEVSVDLERAQTFGVKPGDVRRAAATLLSGITAGNLFEEQKVFDVVVLGTPEIRQSEEDIRQLLIDTPDGGQVALEEVASVAVTSSPTAIRHESVVRYLDVIAQVSGRDPAAVAADVDAALGDVEFPLEHHAELLGGFAEQQVADTRCPGGCSSRARRDLPSLPGSVRQLAPGDPGVSDPPRHHGRWIGRGTGDRWDHHPGRNSRVGGRARPRSARPRHPDTALPGPGAERRRGVRSRSGHQGTRATGWLRP